MGTCYNCNTEITLGEDRTNCDVCGTTLFYHCNNCSEKFEVKDKKTKKKLKECKLCGYFKCPHCSICSWSCQKYGWEKEILKILRPEVTQGSCPNVLNKIRRIVEYIGEERGGQERRICKERGVLISYAKNRIKSLLAKVEGFRVKNENDREAFIKRLDEITTKPIGTELKISEVREAGSYGQEYRDAFNLLVCLGKLRIIKREFKDKDKIIMYEVYIRENNKSCKLLSKEDLIINECTNSKHVGNKRFQKDLIYCPTCKPYSKGESKGQKRKLKKRLNDKDVCQMYRGNFIKKK